MSLKAREGKYTRLVSAASEIDVSSDDQPRLCLNCEYDLRAHPGDPLTCPECGRTYSRSDIFGLGADFRVAQALRADLRSIKLDFTCVVLLTGAFGALSCGAGLVVFVISGAWAFPPHTWGLSQSAKRLPRAADRAAALCCALLEWVRVVFWLVVPAAVLVVAPNLRVAGVDQVTLFVAGAAVVAIFVIVSVTLFDPTAFLARAAIRLEHRLFARLGIGPEARQLLGQPY